MDKLWLVDQLIEQLRNSARVALDASEAAAEEARDGATPAEKREDARAAIEFGSLARAQDRRARRALAEIDRLTGFRPGPCAPDAAVHVGALVEVEDADTGEGRTFFLAPSGAGVTLSGPGGDGFLSVVTQQSPVGRAVIGRRAGDVVDVTVEGEIREWTITWVG
ncbi:MAG: GreA/GreB family elongation factor [Myxococcales bacterium]|nr:GreA/GreB family elongation factor [Myxococcales bacterium]